MDQKKIGLFICSLRKEKNFTQEELSNLIPISRGAVSKWERGVTTPDHIVLLRLSEIFNVSINEILCGERANKNNKEKLENIALNLYRNNRSNKKIIKFLILAIFIFFVGLLFLYFVTSFKSIKVYTISGETELAKISGGIFVDTKDQQYLKLNDFIVKDDQKIKKLELYYYDSDHQKKIIYSCFNDNINIKDYYGYEKYFDRKNLDNIIYNMFLCINYTDDTFELMHLDLKEDYVNDRFWHQKIYNKL